jgi:hypothetical protein
VCMPKEYAAWKVKRVADPTVITQQDDRAEHRLRTTARRQQVPMRTVPESA